MAYLLRPKWVIGGLALYAATAVGAYAHFSKPKEYGTQTEEDRRATFNANSSHYDKDIEVHEKLAGIAAIRKELISKATGKVLEIGAGTGRNISYYTSQAKHVTLVDFSEGMLQQAKLKIEAADPAIAAKFSTLLADAHHLPFSNDDFDTVVDTFSLCSYENPDVVLKEMGRLLKPGGKLLLLEHGQAHVTVLNKMLDKSNAGHVHKHGCYWNRDIDTIVKGSLTAGFRVVNEHRHHMGTTYVYELEKLQ